MIRVLLADDHPMVRAGLTELVGGAADMEVVGAAGGGDEAVRLACGGDPDVVLMDLSMPDVDGVQATRITAERGDARVVVLSDSPLAPKVAAAVLSRARTRQVELTEREKEVLGLVGNGLPNKVIALRLGITEQTVKTHITNIFQRIGVTDRTNAALWARRHGFA